MIIPAPVFSFALWAALGVVAVAATYLLVVLVREWRDGSLW
jgi:hypothetical protein